jgi:hypothetical protein
MPMSDRIKRLAGACLVRILGADNEVVAWRSLAASVVLGVALVFSLAACTGSPAADHASSAQRASNATGAVVRGVGREGCRPPSRRTMADGFPEVEGTSASGSVWALLMPAHPGRLRAGDQEKIVWRVTGGGDLVATAIGPDGQHRSPVWGPEAHLGSNWARPGKEWGTGFVFSTPGCWDLHVRSGATVGDVWLKVAPAA